MTISPEAQKLLDAANAKKPTSPARSSFWGAFAAILVAAGIAGGVYLVQEQKAERAREQAALRRLLSLSQPRPGLSTAEEEQERRRDHERDRRRLRQLELEGRLMMDTLNEAADKASRRTEQPSEQ